METAVSRASSCRAQWRGNSGFLGQPGLSSPACSVIARMPMACTRPGYGAPVGHAGSELPSTSRYELRPRPPIATFAAAAATTIVGCGILAIYGTRSSAAALLVVGMALLIFGMTLAVGALMFVARFRTVVELDVESITIVRGSRQRKLQWCEIKQVSLEGPRLTLQAKPPTEDAVVINPRTPGDPQFMLLMAALSERLDASRGYGGTR
jgi:hypothetical protein